MFTLGPGVATLFTRTEAGACPCLAFSRCPAHYMFSPWSLFVVVNQSYIYREVFCVCVHVCMCACVCAHSTESSCSCQDAVSYCNKAPVVMVCFKFLCACVMDTHTAVYFLISCANCLLALCRIKGLLDAFLGLTCLFAARGGCLTSITPPLARRLSQASVSFCVLRISFLGLFLVLIIFWASSPSPPP